MSTLIIGSGIIGVSTAYFLAREDNQVDLIDKGPIGYGSSFGNAGLLAISHVIPLAHPGMIKEGMKAMFSPDKPFILRPTLSPSRLKWLLQFMHACSENNVRQGAPILSRLARASLELYQSIIQEENIECGFAQKGLLMLYQEEKNFRKAVKNMPLLSKYKITSFIAGERELKDSGYPLKDDIKGISYPEDAHLSPHAFVSKLSEASKKKGARLHPFCEAVSFECKGNKITKVYTTQQEFTPDVIVLAAGSWSRLLAQKLNLSLPVQPALGYSMTLDQPFQVETPLLLEEARIVISPLMQKLRLSGTLDFCGMDERFAMNRIERMKQSVQRFFKERIIFNENVSYWRGLRPVTPNGIPILVRHPQFKNLVISTGHAMLGMTLGLESGRMTKELVTLT